MSNDAAVAVLKSHVLSSTPVWSQKPIKECPSKSSAYLSLELVSVHSTSQDLAGLHLSNPVFFHIHVSCSPGYVALGAKAAEEALSSAGLELRHMDAVVCRCV